MFVDSLKQDHSFLADELEKSLQDLGDSGEIDKVAGASSPAPTGRKLTSGAGAEATADRSRQPPKLSRYDMNLLASYLRGQLLGDLTGDDKDGDDKDDGGNDDIDDGDGRGCRVDGVFTKNFGRYVSKRLQDLSVTGCEDRATTSTSPHQPNEDYQSEVFKRSLGILIPPSAYRADRRDRVMKSMFDKVYDLINSGDFERVSEQFSNICAQPRDADIRCVLLYMEASAHLYKGNLKESNRALKLLLKLIPFTSTPSIVIMEAFSLKCWISIKENAPWAIGEHIRDAVQTAILDPVRCSGRALAWIFVKEAERLCALLSNDDLSRSYQHRAEAMKCLYKALGNFQIEDNNEGLVGSCLVSIRLASVILACGDTMQAIDLQPAESEIRDVSCRLREVENRLHELPDILRLQFYIAKSDLHFRRHDLGCALNRAEDALSLGKLLELPYETRVAQSRFNFHRNLHYEAMTTPIRNRRRWSCPRHDIASTPVSTDQSTSGSNTDSGVTRTAKSNRLPPHRLSFRSRNRLHVTIEQTTDSDACSPGLPDKRMKPRFPCGIQNLKDIPHNTALQLRPKIGFFVRVWILVVLFSGCWLYRSL